MPTPVDPRAVDLAGFPSPVARTTTLFVIVGVLSAACHLRAYAQDYGTGRGGWFNAAIGRGWAQFACDTCHRGPRAGDWGVLLGFGETRDQQLRVGLVLNVSDRLLRDGETMWAITTVSPWLRYYPCSGRTLFVEGGIGPSEYRLLKGLHEGLLFENADTTYASGWGLGSTLAAGWDIPIGHGDFALTPRVAYVYGTPRTLHSPRGATVARGWTQNVVSIGVEFVINPLESN